MSGGFACTDVGTVFPMPLRPYTHEHPSKGPLVPYLLVRPGDLSILPIRDKHGWVCDSQLLKHEAMKLFSFYLQPPFVIESKIAISGGRIE